MANYGLSVAPLLALLLNLILILAWPVLSIIGLFQLRKQTLPATAKAIWALIILVIPLFGAIAYWIVRPSEL